jgi:predicted deacylase
MPQSDFFRFPLQNASVISLRLAGQAGTTAAGCPILNAHYAFRVGSRKSYGADTDSNRTGPSSPDGSNGESAL